MNVLIVPDEGGQSRRLNLPLFIIKFAAWILLIVVVGIIAAIVFYSRFAQKALDWDRLAGENERLMSENKRILSAAREVEESRRVLADILRTYQEKKKPIPDILLQAGANGGPGGLSDEAASILKGRLHSPEQFLAYGLPSLMPVKGFISQRFQEDEFFPERNHLGIDIAAPSDEPIVAAASGHVVFEGWTPYFGNCLMIAHREGYLTFYGHNRQNLKMSTDDVRRGEPIALLGNTGRSSAPHLHFEIWKDGAPVDPAKLLKFK